MKHLRKEYIVGFANQYYTLWVRDHWKKTITGAAGTPTAGYIIGYSYIEENTYLQNLSFDEAKALEKARLMSDQEVSLDMDLKGTSSFQHETDYKMEKNVLKVRDWTIMPTIDRFQYLTYANETGRLMHERCILTESQTKIPVFYDEVLPLGETFLKRTRENYRGVQHLLAIYNLFTLDIQMSKAEGRNYTVFNCPGSFLYSLKIFPCKHERTLLERWYNMPNARHAVVARKRLVELGELIRFEGRYLRPHQYVLEMKKRDENNVFHFNEGDKVTVEIELVDKKSYPTVYGFTFLQFFKDSEGRNLMYSGGSPKNLNIGDKIKVTATVKHSEYRGTKQTLLQRMKIQK